MSDPSDQSRGAPATVSRRTLLGGTLSIGALGAVTGLGTRALLSDDARLSENTLESGSLDLGLAWRETYNGQRVEAGGSCGSSDPDDYVDTDAAVVTLDAVEPGDEGAVTCCPRLRDDGADVWVRIVLGATPENGRSPVEGRNGDDTPREGELQDELGLTVWTDRDCDTTQGGGTTVASGTFASVVEGPVGTGLRLGGGEAAPPCLGVRWSLPADAPPVVLSDAVEFSIEFAAEQTRHDDSQTNPWRNA